MSISPENGSAEALYERARRVMPGGVSRNTVLRKPYPIYVESGSGCYVTDTDNNVRIDLANNMASLIHGHAHPAVISAVSAQMGRGTAFTLATEVEIDYAEYLISRSPNFEQIRFVNSGTEAVMGAIKAARAYTGRAKIAKVEGAYHGAYDFAEVSQTSCPASWGSLDAPESVPVTHGTPPSVLGDVIILPFNDPERAVAILDRHRGTVAGVLLDMMPHRVGLATANPDFVTALRDWASDDGALLIADEVITFRTTYGGAQQAYDLAPDLTALGKVIGGGFPVGAITGRAEVMGVMDPLGDGYRMPFSGTFSANPISMTAGLIAMSLFDESEVERLNGLAAMARSGIAAAINSSGARASVTGAGSMFRVRMAAEAPTGYRDSFADEAETARQLSFFNAMLDEGILMIYSGAGAISTPMSHAEIERLISAVTNALRSQP